MKKLVLVLWMALGPALAQGELERSVLEGVRQAMKESGGRVTFSDLYNDSRFSAEQKTFLGRLYEVFFEIPGFLKSEFQSAGEIPSRAAIASRFEISPASVELLLRVMKSDPRVPPLFERDASSGEITELKLDAIDAFVSRRGDQVKLTQWEGRPLPAFDLERFEGGRFSSQSLRGRPGLIYFWFTGCPPCVRIAPSLAQLDRKYGAEGFQTVGLNADRILGIEVSENQREAYLEKTGSKYPQLHLTEDVRAAFGNVNVYPTLFFFNRQGMVVRHLLNDQDQDALEAIYRELVSP